MIRKKCSERHLVAGLDAPGGEHAGDLIGRGVHLRVRQPLRAEHHGGAVRVEAGAVLQENGEVEHPVDPLFVCGCLLCDGRLI